MTKQLTCYNEILIRRRNKVLLDENHTASANSAAKSKIGSWVPSQRSDQVLVAGLKNLQELGYTVDATTVIAIRELPWDHVAEFFFEIIRIVKELTGADVEYKPMYPNFPDQVAEAQDAELFINAVLHYITDGSFLPLYQKKQRLPLLNANQMTVLSAGTVDDIEQIFKNLVQSKTSLSLQDREDLADIMRVEDSYSGWLPDVIPHKENAAYICGLILQYSSRFSYMRDLHKYIKTATDVLRLLAAMSDGDVSLASPTRYKSIRRWQRRAILDLLNGLPNLTEDFWRNRNEWLRVGEILHPFELCKTKRRNVGAAFDSIRNNHKPLMWRGQVQACLQQHDSDGACELLKQRPGEFARSLDYLLRSARDGAERNNIINAFERIAKQVSTPVLLQVRQHFKGRDKVEKSIRVYFPKGNIAKVRTIDKQLPHLSEYDCGRIIAICSNALINVFHERDCMGNVYIDPSFRELLVPFCQRSSSKSIKAVVRGSKFPMAPDPVVRGFIWWTNSGGNRVDIDLSANVFDENWNLIEHISYTNLRSASMCCYHSGDIVDGGAEDGCGVAEFIDLNISKIVQNQGRYVVFQVYLYTMQTFMQLSHVRFGWMGRSGLNDGQIFEPSTVQMKMDLASDSPAAIPVIFDCITHEAIWCDLNLRATDHRMDRPNNLENNLYGVRAACYAMTQLNKPTLYDLIALNACARGRIVHDVAKANIVFSNNVEVPLDDPTQVITAFDTDFYMGQLL